MKVEEILHMAGDGGENSYANNSRIQANIILRAKSIVEETIGEICNTVHTGNFVVTDLGCSFGPNTFLVITQIVNAIENYYRQIKQNRREILYFLNDLPSNDFNKTFKHLMLYEKKLRDEKGEEYVPIHVAGMPGSFYGRLFPSKSVHFFHSSCSLNWLSQVPGGLANKNYAELNKGNIYIADASSSIVYRFYLNQFKSDFSKFLTSRSKELILGGKMVLSLAGRKNYPTNGDIFHLFWLLTDALKSMISEGVVEETKLDAFNVPFYVPLMEEVKSTIEMEGSFSIDQALTYESKLSPFDDSIDTFEMDITKILEKDNNTRGQNLARNIIAILEPLLKYYFGDDIMDELFLRFVKNIVKHVSLEKAKAVILMLALKLKE